MIMSRSDENATAEGESTAKTLLVRAVNVPYRAGCSRVNKIL